MSLSVTSKLAADWLGFAQSVRSQIRAQMAQVDSFQHLANAWKIEMSPKSLPLARIQPVAVDQWPGAGVNIDLVA